MSIAFITRSLVAFTLLLGLGCDAEQELDAPEWSASETSDAPADSDLAAAPLELGDHGWTELPSEQSDIAAPPSQGVCGGYWEYKGTVEWQGCGTCMHTAPHPDRPGNLGLFKKRWCWTGAGCTGCEPWVVNSSKCYDTCS